MKTREKTKWSGEYKGVAWEVQRWPGEAVRVTKRLANLRKLLGNSAKPASNKKPNLRKPKNVPPRWSDRVSTGDQPKAKSTGIPGKRKPCKASMVLGERTLYCHLKLAHKGFHSCSTRWGTITIRIGKSRQKPRQSVGIGNRRR